MARWRIIGWKLDPKHRTLLLQHFPPAYPRVVADHVTLAAGAPKDQRLPVQTSGEIVGRADDGGGVEALVVAIDGSTDRPSGGVFHITWSLGPGRKPVESNEAIAALGWVTLASPIPIRLWPADLTG